MFWMPLLRVWGERSSVLGVGGWGLGPGLPRAGVGLGARTCAVGEKGVMAGIVDGRAALALAIPNMRGLT